MLKPDAPTRRRIITDKNKMNLDVHKQRWKMLKQGAPTRRRIIPQKMKPRCPNKRDESILKTRCINKGDESILKKMYQQGWDESILKSMYQQGRWKYSQHDVFKDGHSENTKKKVRCNLGVIILQLIKLTFTCVSENRKREMKAVSNKMYPQRSQRKSLRKYKEESQM